MTSRFTGRISGQPQWWCPECGEPARHGKPLRWNPTWGPRPRHSHLDGTPLCPVMTEHGYRPTPATTDMDSNRQRGRGQEPPMSASWYARSMARAARDLRRALEYGQPVDLAAVAATVCDTMRAVEKVSQHMEVAALTAHTSVGFQVIRAGALAEHTALAFAEVHLFVLLAGHADRRRNEGGDAS